MEALTYIDINLRCSLKVFKTLADSMARAPTAEMAASLNSSQWSCSSLAQGAQVCADMAGMELKVDPGTMTRDELLQSIQDAYHIIILITSFGIFWHASS